MPPPPPPRPNIVIIVADDLGYGDLGAYGQQRIQTPNLDRLAGEGLRFTQAYAGSSVCSPSRNSLFAGRHTGHTHVRGNDDVGPLPADTGTLGTLLHGAGYATGLVGKWDLGPVGTTGSPNAQGFGHFFGYDSLVAAHNNWPAFLWWNDQQVPLRNAVREVPTYYSKTPGSVATDKGEYAPDLIAEAALKFVKAEQAGHPFLLVWTPTLPHANNEAPPGEALEVPDLGPYANEDWPLPARQYAAMVTRLDAHVGALVDHLEQGGLADNTLVLFTSDNGPHREGGYDPAFLDSNGPLRGAKRDLYEGGIRVPLIAWGAGVQAGTSDTPVALWDLWATCAMLSGAATDDRDGLPLPLHPLIQSTPPTGRALYWEFHEQPKARAVRWGKWKLIDFFAEGRVELYDLMADPGETTDLAAAHPEHVKTGMDLLRDMRTPSEHWPVPGAE